MLVETAVLSAIAYGLYIHTVGSAKPQSRTAVFKDPYNPVESDINDHTLRNVPFGFNVGNTPGKWDYKNPLPLRVVDEYKQVLVESDFGWPGPLTSRAINSPGYQVLINQNFNEWEHPRLDITLQDIDKGKMPRPQSAIRWFYLEPEK